MSYPRRSKKKVRYHGRSGFPIIHQASSGRRFIMVRKKGGGTGRLYEGSKYNDGTQDRVLKLD